MNFCTLFALIGFLVKFSTITAANALTGNVSMKEKARNMLLENTRKLHSKDSIAHKHVDDLVVFNRIMQFSDVNDLLELFQTSKRLKKCAVQEIKNRLQFFDKHYIFKEDWFNAVVFKILSFNFPSNFTLKNSEFRDYAILMILKYASDESRKLKMPRYIFAGILSFILESAFGKGYSVPLENASQLIHFLGHELQKHDLPKSLEYFIKFIHSPNSRQGKLRNPFLFNATSRESISNLLRHLASKPSVEAHRNYYDTLSEQQSTRVHDYLLEERLEEPIQDAAHLNSIIANLKLIKPVSTTILNRVKDVKVLDNLSKSDPPHWLTSVLFRKFGITAGSPAKDYLCTVDYDNEFSVEKFQELSGTEQELFEILTQTDMPLIIKLDIISKYAKSNGYINDTVDYLHSNNMILLEMILHEKLFRSDVSKSYFLKYLPVADYDFKRTLIVAFLVQNLMTNTRLVDSVLMFGYEVYYILMVVISKITNFISALRSSGQIETP